MPPCCVHKMVSVEVIPKLHYEHLLLKAMIQASMKRNIRCTQAYYSRRNQWLVRRER